MSIKYFFILGGLGRLKTKSREKYLWFFYVHLNKKSPVETGLSNLFGRITSLRS
jgi:hypothetical protein